MSDTTQKVDAWNQGWVSLRDYFDALRAADARFDGERDRRISEVKLETEKALAIKTEADKTALGLSRTDDEYKREQANNLRQQIGSERGEYVTRIELKPIADWVVGQQGRGSGLNSAWVTVVAGAGCLAMVGSFLVGAIALALVIYRSIHS